MEVRTGMYVRVTMAIFGSVLLVGCGAGIAPASPADTSGETTGQICAADPSNLVCAGLDTSQPTVAPTAAPTPTANNLEGPVGRRSPTRTHRTTK